MHVWLDVQESSMKHEKISDKPLDDLASTPAEFRSILQCFSTQQIRDAYPLLQVDNDPLAREYLSVLYFLQLHQWYDFVWVLESDVRYTGTDWGVFLNSMLNVATATLAGRPHKQFSDSIGRIQYDFEIPDFISVSRNRGLPTLRRATSGRAPRDMRNWKLPAMVQEFTFLWGMSRQYINVLHRHSMEGSGGYIEEFLLTLALHENLRVVIMPYTQVLGESWHCCLDAGQMYYEDWFLSNECRLFTLVHPIKNANTSIWGPDWMIA